MQILKCTLLCFLAFVASSAFTQAAQVVPIQDPHYLASLNGIWKFRYVAGSQAGTIPSFFETTFDDADWSPIQVPGNWEMQGFATPKYGSRLEDGHGLYRQSFVVPPDWNRERKVFLRFDGVAYGYRVWVNGTQVGASSASAYNPHTFEITDAIVAGQDNQLAVWVTTNPRGYRFDLNDAWSLSGIFRNVTLFSTPQTYLQEVTLRTEVSADNNAELQVVVALSGKATHLSGQLTSPSGRIVRRFTLDKQKELPSYNAKVTVPDAQLWTAETPHLYTLGLQVMREDQVVQSWTQKTGLRQTTIDGDRLLLNNRPIKLRGVTHHDLSPETGRALSMEQIRQDLLLMRQANINFIRTSHYPCDQRMLDLCDEMGFYVMLEVPLSSRGGAYLTDPANHDLIRSRVEATVGRDKNHPAVIIWSVGNENHMNKGEIFAINHLKKLDPTRPTLLPKTAGTFGKNRSHIPECVDLYSAHYPTSNLMKAWTTRLNRPMIFSEYAHAQGLATERIASQWGIIQSHPGYAGGSIWHFHDQGILRPSPQPVQRNKSTVYVWPHPQQFYDTGEKLSSKRKGLDGADGIVYADRTPQTDFWEVRKVYAPVQISPESARVQPGPQVIVAQIENRFDFRSLKGFKLAWCLQQNGTTIQQGEAAISAASQSIQEIEIPVEIPQTEFDVLALELLCLDEEGQPITERVVRLNCEEQQPKNWAPEMPSEWSPQVRETAERIQLTTTNIELKVQRQTGKLELFDSDGNQILAGLHPHPGRKRLLVETSSKGSRFGYWPASLLTQPEQVTVDVVNEETGVGVVVKGTYPHPRDRKQSLMGQYQVMLSPDGLIHVSFEYLASSSTGRWSEAGVSLVLPKPFTEFRWIGKGPYAGYPGKERLNEFGIYHLNREDLRFQGNRRQTDVAMLTTKEGNGVAILTSQADVSVERDDAEQQTLLSYNAVVSSLGNKIGGPEYVLKTDKHKPISGKFSLLLLDNQWPKQIEKWFAATVPDAPVLAPFFHSYDQ